MVSVLMHCVCNLYIVSELIELEDIHQIAYLCSVVMITVFILIHDAYTRSSADLCPSHKFYDNFVSGEIVRFS